MVWIVASSRGQGPGPARCQSLPAPRPGASYWEQTARQQQARLTLPPFSLRDPKRPSDLKPLFEGFQAALPLNEAEWALNTSFQELSSLQGPAEALQAQLQPRALEPDEATGPLPSPVPAFLLGGRTPRLNHYLLEASTTMDVPIIFPGPADMWDDCQAALSATIMRECGIEPLPEAPVPPVDRQKYACWPEALQEQPPAAKALPPFKALDSLLEQLPAAVIAAPRMLDVPLPLPLNEADSAAAGNHLRRELEHLAAGSFDVAEAGAELAGSGFISLKDLPALRCFRGGAAGAAPAPTSETVRCMAVPALMRLPEPAPVPSAIPSFLLHPGKGPAAVVGPGDAGSGGAARHLFTLEAPVLLISSPECTAGSATLGAPISAFAELFQPVTVPQMTVEPCFAPEGCTPASLASLIAQDLVLDDCGLVLPAVTFEEDGGEEESGAALLSLMVTECGVKPANTAHLALYLDWSLSSKQTATRPAALVVAMRCMRQQLLPALLPSAAFGCRAGRYRAALVEQLLAPFRVAGKAQSAVATKQLAPAAAAAARVQLNQAPPLPVAQQEAGEQQAAAGGSVPHVRGQGGQQQVAKRAKRGTAEDGMQYFLRLQHGRLGAAARTVGADSTSSSSSSEDGTDALELHMRQPSTSVHSVELPAIHAQLLQLLHEDEQQLVRSAPMPGVAPELARSDFLSVDVLQRALEQAAGKPGKRDLLKVYAAMAVIRQTAATLVHHGIRCAHLYLSQSQVELPGMLNTVTAARELRAAYQQVESGRLEDSPKHAVLKRLLGGIATLAPGCKCCIVGHPKSFFTLYKAVLGSGAGQVCHFDREGRLASGGASSEQVAAAVQQACASAACVLVACELVERGGFPLAAFQQVVVYASERDSHVALKAQLGELSCPLHFLEVTQPSQPSAPAAPPQHQAMLMQSAGQQQLGAAGQGGGREGAVSLVQHLSRPAVAAASAAEQVAVADWPIIISSDPSRPIRSCRQLYEAVLGVERFGGAVVERRLALVDLVLSPSAGLVICDNTASKLEFDGFLAAVGPVLCRLSYAFARIVLVCEGSAGFQAQVLCGTESLLALGRRCSLHLQLHATTSSKGTAAVVGSVVRAGLARWQAADPGLHYAVPDMVSEEEAFLTRFYCINPHTAALLLSLGLSLRQLLCLDSINPLQLPKALSLVPAHCLELFMATASHGVPVLGLPTASAMHQLQQEASVMLQVAAASPHAHPGGGGSPAQGSTMPCNWQQLAHQQHAGRMISGAAPDYGGTQGEAWDRQLPGRQTGGDQQYSDGDDFAAGHAAVQLAHRHMPTQAYRQVQQQQQLQQHRGVEEQVIIGHGGSMRNVGMNYRQVYELPQQQGHQAGRGSSGYMEDHLVAQQQHWEPFAQTKDKAYVQGMQFMQARLRGMPGGAAQLLLPQQHQQWQYADLGQEQPEYQYQRHQQHQMQRQEVAEAFPEINADWDVALDLPASGAVGGGGHQQQRASQQHSEGGTHYGAASMLPLPPGLPPLPRRTAGTGAYGDGAAWGQQQGQGRDEFGVSVQPSLSDDDSDVAGPSLAGMRQSAGQPALRVQQMHELLLPGRGQAAAVMPAQLGPASEGQMEAFLSSRKRDFSVPRIAKPGLASRQLPTLQHARGAGVMAAQTAEYAWEEATEEVEKAHASKRQRGTTAAAAPRLNNLMRPGGGSQRGAGGNRRNGGAGGRWGGGGGRRGGRWGGGGNNKPSRAW